MPNGRIPACALAGLVLLSCAFAEYEVGGIVLAEGPQDLVSVTGQEWAWRSGAESFPAISVKLSSGRFTYELRHDRKSGDGTIGLSMPGTANWYQSGMLHLLINGQRFPLLPQNSEQITLTSGRRGKAVFSWENDVARVTYSFVLAAGQDRLYLRIHVAPKSEIDSLRVQLQNYVSGFNHSPEHIIHTPARVLEGRQRHSLDPATESALFYSDASLDLAGDNGGSGPSALALDGREVTALAVHTGGYGAPTIVEYNPAARQLAFCFWELPDRTNAEGLACFNASRVEALEQMLADETYE